MVRLRRVQPRFPIGRAYEIELAPGERRRTRSPLSALDPLLGVGDAWSVIHAADRAWDGHEGAWVGLVDPAPDPGGQGS